MRVRGGLSSCIDKLREQGFYVSKLADAVVIRPGEVAHTNEVKYFLYLSFTPIAVKRIRLKYKCDVLATTFPLHSIKCGCGIAIKRVVMWIYDPLAYIVDIINMLTQITIILELVRSLSAITM